MFRHEICISKIKGYPMCWNVDCIITLESAAVLVQKENLSQVNIVSLSLIKNKNLTTLQHNNLPIVQSSSLSVWLSRLSYYTCLRIHSRIIEVMHFKCTFEHNLCDLCLCVG